MHPKLAPFFKGREQFYPKTLEEGYPRVFNEILNKWGSSEMEIYLGDLMVDKRGGRQGFPPDVMNDILTLSRIHDHVQSLIMAGNKKKEDIWGSEPIKKALQAEQIDYSKEGFFRAAELGNERAIAIFLKTGIDLETKNSGGWTPLIIASAGGKLKAIIELINGGANVNATDPQGLTSLHWAAFKGYPRLTELLIDKGADVNAKSNLQLTPLSQAVTSGHAEIVSILLNMRANINAADGDGLTPLHNAVADGNLEIVKLLVAAGADREAKSNRGLTPGVIAKQRNKSDIIAALSV
jgi:ankyrin repeat protein